jgi:HAD superfamily hydrolase (TIGR01509 family)
MDRMGGPLHTLFLDAGGVLVHPNWARVSAALAREGVRAEATLLAAAEPHAKRALDRPERIQASSDAARVFPYFELVLEHAGIDRSPGTEAALGSLRAYHARHNLWECVPPEVVPALTSFRAAGLGLAVVSNANGTLRALLERLRLTSFFRAVLDSQEEGFEKPDPRIFEIALARCEARPETTIHVGDFYHVDVTGARAAGLGAVLLDAAGLYEDHDCPRVSSLRGLAEVLTPGR